MRPATVNVPARGADPGFDSATKLTLPDPGDGTVVTVTHDALLAADQAQPDGVATPTAPAPPEAGTDPLDDSRL